MCDANIGLFEPQTSFWSPWYRWSECSVSCGVGQKRRSRECTTAGLCNGPVEESESCTRTSCPVLKLGTGAAPAFPIPDFLSSFLQSPEEVVEQPSTESPFRAFRRLGVHLEGGWTAWGSWRPCSTSCGRGLRRRSRICTVTHPSVLSSSVSQGL